MHPADNILAHQQGGVLRMHIEAGDFRVREGDRVDLKRWPTRVEPVYQTDEQYQEILAKHVRALSAYQDFLILLICLVHGLDPCRPSLQINPVSFPD